MRRMGTRGSKKIQATCFLPTLIAGRQRPFNKAAGKNWLFCWSGIRVRKLHKQEKDLAFCQLYLLAGSGRSTKQPEKIGCFVGAA